MTAREYLNDIAKGANFAYLPEKIVVEMFYLAETEDELNALFKYIPGLPSRIDWDLLKRIKKLEEKKMKKIIVSVGTLIVVILLVPPVANAGIIHRIAKTVGGTVGGVVHSFTRSSYSSYGSSSGYPGPVSRGYGYGFPGAANIHTPLMTPITVNGQPGTITNMNGFVNCTGPAFNR